MDSNEVKDALAKSFEITNRALYNDSGIDIYFSGSTCVTVVIGGNKDTRLIVITRLMNRMKRHVFSRVVVE